MARQAARDDVDGVDAKRVAVAHETGREAFRGGDHPAQAPLVERELRRVHRGARLDLDEGERATTPGDDIHFAAGDPRAPRKNPPAVEPEPEGGEALGAAAASFGGEAIH